MCYLWNFLRKLDRLFYTDWALIFEIIKRLIDSLTALTFQNHKPNSNNFIDYAFDRYSINILKILDIDGY